MSDAKDTNPKDAIGVDKLPLDLVPQTGIVFESLAFLEGALKYGAFNWRIVGVRSSIYFAACLRHLFKWWNGEECDPKTRVPHLANARACLNILLDARGLGKLTDDRPPMSPEMVKLIDEAQEIVVHLKKTFEDCNPRHFTIADSESRCSSESSSNSK